MSKAAVQFYDCSTGMKIYLLLKIFVKKIFFLAKKISFNFNPILETNTKKQNSRPRPKQEEIYFKTSLESIKTKTNNLELFSFLFV